jgi:hypothetical protein
MTTTTMAKLDRVSALLDKVAELSLGHPDRLRLLTIAEQVLEEGSSDRPSAHQDRANRVAIDGCRGLEGAGVIPKDPFAP